jgi:hypothetical protein
VALTIDTSRAFRTSVFCTWATSLNEEFLIERIGACSPEKLHELDVAMELAGA